MEKFLLGHLLPIRKNYTFVLFVPCQYGLSDQQHIPKIKKKKKKKKKKKPDELLSDSSYYLKDKYASDLPPTPLAVPQDGVQPFDTPLVENSPLTSLSQTWVITPSIKASHPFDKHKQLIPLPTTSKELKDLKSLPSVKLDNLESTPPLAKQDEFDPSTF